MGGATYQSLHTPTEQQAQRRPESLSTLLKYKSTKQYVKKKDSGHWNQTYSSQSQKSHMLAERSRPLIKNKRVRCVTNPKSQKLFNSLSVGKT